MWAIMSLVLLLLCEILLYSRFSIVCQGSVSSEPQAVSVCHGSIVTYF